MKSSTKRVRKYRLKKEILKCLNVSEIKNKDIESESDFSIRPSVLDKKLDDNLCSRAPYSNIQPNQVTAQPDQHTEEEDDHSSHSSNNDDHCWDYGYSKHSDYYEDSSEECGEDGSNKRLELEKLLNEKPEFKQLRQWAVISRIPKAHLDSLLNILKKRVLPDIPSSSKTFLCTTAAKYTIIPMEGLDGLPAEYTYIGIKEGLQKCVNPSLHMTSILKIDFNIDGVQIKKSSRKTMWPILCKVFYEFTPNIYKPFVVCIFYGNQKPKNDFQYFKSFICEINDLLKNGIIIESQTFSVEIRSFICDTPARAFIKSIKGHTSFNGCERCDTVAKKVDNTTVYVSIGKKRSREDFKSFVDLDHHVGVSPLTAIQPEINFINVFVLDSMHLLYLGIMLRLFENWMTGELGVKLSATQKSELNRRTTMLKSDIPKEFERKIQPSNYFDKYKAVEHRFFVLYCGPIVLKKILNEKLYEHFLLFHVSCRLLSRGDAVNFTNLARDYLRKFVQDSIALYGETFVSLNVHCLLHLPDDVEHMQCNLNNISAFPYETELGKIKHILLSPHRTVAQYCRRLHEEREILDHQAKPLQKLLVIKKGYKNEIKQLKYKQKYFTNKHPDNTALLKNGKVVGICKIFYYNKKIYLQVVQYKIKKSLYSTPCDSSMLHIYEIEDRGNVTSDEIKNISLEEIETKLVKISINFSSSDAHRCFVLPLLH